MQEHLGIWKPRSSTKSHPATKLTEEQDGLRMRREIAECWTEGKDFLIVFGACIVSLGGKCYRIGNNVWPLTLHHWGEDFKPEAWRQVRGKVFFLWPVYPTNVLSLIQ